MATSSTIILTIVQKVRLVAEDITTSKIMNTETITVHFLLDSRIELKLSFRQKRLHRINKYTTANVQNDVYIGLNLCKHIS